ncbi:beta carboxy-cis-cis-muconate lactonizing enzyme, cyloisomerase, CLME2 [Phyllosticta citribraziliensis]|uniref:Beta carboxy-cis-cis-muconate lactonizing enzyme, cyloisomerase, CLME2 n=1 Tax=Phyllosticta citribraziliensis TaxID=989973 RepID=A0ABR1M306_9PEZI
MTSVTDSVIFGNILSTPECAAIWSDKQRTSYYLDFEAHLAKVQAELGIIPAEAASAIGAHCRLELYSWDELRAQTERIGYPVLPVVKQLVAMTNASAPGKNLGEWAHWGATTQDVTDTATSLQLRDTFELVSTSLESIIKHLRRLAEEHKHTPMAARSNLQQAVPQTLGFKLARLLSTFARHRARLSSLQQRVLLLEFSGAAGTLATLPPTLALECQTRLAASLSLAAPPIAWHTERDNISESGSFLALLSSTCAKFATDVALLMQTEVDEVREPAGPERGASSTMPQKRNPIGSAYVVASAATARQLSAALAGAVVADHERSTGPWEVEWIVLPQLCCLALAALRHTEDVLARLEVRPEAMARNLDITAGGVVSEAVMMAVAGRLGRQVAHDLVYELCAKAREEGRALADVLVEDGRVGLSRDEAERLCDPRHYLGLSVEMTERVLRETA